MGTGLSLGVYSASCADGFVRFFVWCGLGILLVTINTGFSAFCRYFIIIFAIVLSIIATLLYYTWHNTLLIQCSPFIIPYSSAHNIPNPFPRFSWTLQAYDTQISDVYFLLMILTCYEELITAMCVYRVDWAVYNLYSWDLGPIHTQFFTGRSPGAGYRENIPIYPEIFI